jgi:integrase
VPLGVEVVARMRMHRMAVGRPEDGERVFPFDPRAMFHRAVKAAKLDAPARTIHSMRHTAATWWLGAGLTVHAVADLLGHRDPTLVIKLYGHALKREQQAAGEQLERFLREASTAS